MARIFNNREGFGPADDSVIRRWHEPMPDGPLKGQRIDPKEFRLPSSSIMNFPDGIKMVNPRRAN
jgi:hypothetical protein